MARILIVFAATVSFLFIGCESNSGGKNDADTPSTVGKEGGPCYPNDTCDDGLECVNDICVSILTDADEAGIDEISTDEDESITDQTDGIGSDDDTEPTEDDSITEDDETPTEEDFLPDEDTYLPGCGSGNIDDGETCELGDTTDCALIPDKNYASGTTASCNNSCTGWLDIVCTACGNGALDNGELCEKGTTLDCASIPGKSYETGTLATCNNACTGWDDKDVCTVETPLTCGNGAYDEGEELCEKGLETACVDIPGMNYADAGNALCNDTCTGWNDAVVCTTCGNGVKDGGETCEAGSEIDCGDIAGKNYESGTNATCNDTCTGWNDAVVCTLKPIETCDNGVYDPGFEVCEKGLTTPCEDIPGMNYAAVGDATCNDTCTGWNDATVCTTCGNGTKEVNELCEKGWATPCGDIPDTDYADKGNATCNDTCDGWDDATACTTCGNGVKDASEVCEGSVLSCADAFGNYTGETACLDDCTGYDIADCTAATRTYTCNDKPATGTAWNTVSSYTQTWSGSAWLPADDATTEYNATASTTSCRYKCATNYTWNGSDCVANTRTYTCSVKPASNTVWNTVSSYTQTWDGSAWSPADDSVTEYNTTASATSCQYTCATNYDWNGTSCVAGTRTYTCNDKPATGTVWNTVPSYTQTWTGTAWNPADDATTDYNTTSSTTSCRYKCDTNYTWNGSTCVADTHTYSCAAKPSTGTVWNTVSSYLQTWDGSAWTPVDDPLTDYNTLPSTTECQFACATNYTWDGSTCVADTKTYTCNAKPETGTVWNTVSSYSQTWTGAAWNPADDATTDYNVTASTTSCRYKCDTNYTWNGSACIADTKTFTCNAKPATGTAWNTVTSYLQTWDGAAWSPADDATTDYNVTASTTSCRYKCDTNYSWDGDSCEADTKTYTCNPIPTENGVWNTVYSYLQTWSGSAWLPVDDASTEYNETASETSCRFVCDTGYVWNVKTSACVVADECGNGVVETGEDCDDDNDVDGDACHNDCSFNPGAICTLQNACYNDTTTITCPTEGDAFYGQDSQYISHCYPRSYSITDGTVYDNNTGLMWQKDPYYSIIKFPTWQEAQTYCLALSLEGYDDWRLPSITELESLVAYNRASPTIDTTVFPTTHAGYRFWSNTLSYNSSSAWIVDFTLGWTTIRDKTYDDSLARCVRGAPWPSTASSFTQTTVAGKVIVTDSLTGLMWTKDMAPYSSWQDALSYCEGLNYGGHTDWRLPNANEIKNILNRSLYSPASDFPFPTSYTGLLWSSTTYFPSKEYAVQADLTFGQIYPGGDLSTKTYTGSSAICVRDD